MKKMFNKILILLFGGILLSSCNDVIQVKLDEGSKLYVIDAFVNDMRKDQVIKLTTSYSFFSAEDPPYVSGANVILKDITENKQYVFNYTSNGNYVYPITTADTIAKPGHFYELYVTIEGNTYTSSGKQNRAALIENIITDPVVQAFGPVSEDTTFTCVLIAKDKSDNVPDYYWIRGFRNDSLIDTPNEVNVCIDGTGGAVTNTADDSIYFTPPGTLLNFKEYKINSKCGAEVHAISRENYFWFIQASAQINNGGLFATTPENVKTNIITPKSAKTAATGRFSMASVSSFSIIVRP
jgi:hypothetical protein